MNITNAGVFYVDSVMSVTVGQCDESETTLSDKVSYSTE